MLSFVLLDLIRYFSRLNGELLGTELTAKSDNKSLAAGLSSYNNYDYNIVKQNTLHIADKNKNIGIALLISANITKKKLYSRIIMAYFLNLF